MIKDWKKTNVDQWRTLWTKGDKRFGDFIMIDKKPEGYEVSANRKINPKTIYGYSKYFKTKSQALRFAKNYMRKN